MGSALKSVRDAMDAEVKASARRTAKRGPWKARTRTETHGRGRRNPPSPNPEAIGDDGASDFLVSVPVSRNWVNTTEWADGGEKDAPGWRRKAVRLVERLLGLSTSARRTPPAGKVDPLRVLLEAKMALSDVSDCLDRMKAYDDAICEAARGGQTARAEKLMLARKTVQQESVLRAGGFTKFLSEAQVVESASKCQRGLRLDWAANFTRPFPKEALARKVLGHGPSEVGEDPTKEP